MTSSQIIGSFAFSSNLWPNVHILEVYISNCKQSTAERPPWSPDLKKAAIADLLLKTQ